MPDTVPSESTLSLQLTGFREKPVRGTGNGGPQTDLPVCGLGSWSCHFTKSMILAEL